MNKRMKCSLRGGRSPYCHIACLVKKNMDDKIPKTLEAFSKAGTGGAGGRHCREQGSLAHQVCKLLGLHPKTP